jgi:hypothetical protein
MCAEAIDANFATQTSDTKNIRINFDRYFVPQRGSKAGGMISYEKSAAPFAIKKY